MNGTIIKGQTKGQHDQFKCGDKVILLLQHRPTGSTSKPGHNNLLLSTTRYAVSSLVPGPMIHLASASPAKKPVSMLATTC